MDRENIPPPNYVRKKKDKIAPIASAANSFRQKQHNKQFNNRRSKHSNQNIINDNFTTTKTITRYTIVMILMAGMLVA